MVNLYDQKLYQASLKFFEITFLYNVQNYFNSSIICCLFLVECKFIGFFYFFLPAEVILSAIFCPIKSPVASAEF